MRERFGHQPSRARRWFIAATVLGTQAGFAAVSSDSGASSPPGRPDSPDGVLQRPAGQKGQNSTISSVSRDISWATCPSPNSCTLSFDYFVDSEYGHDRLLVWLDQEPVPRFDRSGFETGHAILNIPPGSHVVKFQYLKDVSVSVGLDTAWVDKVIAADKSGTRNVSFFDHEVWMTPTPPWNWTGSGQSGGWVVVERPPDRAIERPNAQYHLPNSWSAIYRYVNVPAGPIRKLAFDYFIDSEVNDYLVVLVNSSAVWYLGGIGKRGTAEVPLFPGNNQVMFAYVKNGAVDGGTDNASVDRIRLVGETRQSLVSDFDGLEPFSDHIPGWYFSGSPSNLHWQVRAKGPHLSAVTGFTGDAPGIDGVLSRGEYQEATTTRASLYRYQHRPAQQPPPPTGPELDVSSRLSMTVNPDRHELYLNLQAHAESSLSSVESGEVVVLIDGRRPATLARQGCAGNPTLPEEDDRKWGLTYFFEPQSTRGSVDVRQFAGTCTVGDEWKEVTGGKGEWRTDVAAGRNADNLLVFEMKMELRTAKETTSEPFVTGGFGLGFLRAGADTADHFPYLTGQGPVINNVLSWETVRIGPGSSGDGEWDGCCAPGTAPWRKH